MGKISVTLWVVLAVPSVAVAQDFGVEWVDRVTHERQAERGPLKPMPVAFTASGGAEFYYDSNVFLEEAGRNRDFVTVPFARARLDYAEPQLNAAADVLLDWRGYSREKEAQDFEERFYGHVRYIGARFTAEITELLQHISDPVDVVFLDRAERVVSDTSVKGVYDLSKEVAFEAGGNIEVVRFEKAPFNQLGDNSNFRWDGSLVYRLTNGYDWLVRGGYILIDYVGKQRNGAPPDDDGFYVDLGFRGELSERLSVEAYAGYTWVESVKFINTDLRRKQGTMDAGVHARYEAMERLFFTADYTRLITFAGGSVNGVPDPFQTVNRALLTGEYGITEQLSARGRVQFDHASSALGVVRDYWSLGASVAYKFTEYLSADGGGTWRQGDTHGMVATSTDYDGYILHAGFALTY